MEGLQPSEAEFGALVAQPLLLQSPLQAVLELVWSTLRAQRAAIGALQARVGTLDAAAAAATALRTRHDEAQAAADARLAALESRLHGASNVAGRQAALDEIASLIGVAVPEVAPPQAHVGVLAHPATLSGWAQPAAASPLELADSFVPAGEGSTGLLQTTDGAAAGQPAAMQLAVAVAGGSPASVAAEVESGGAQAAATACEPATAAQGNFGKASSMNSSCSSRAGSAAPAHGPAATEAALPEQQDREPYCASLASGPASQTAAVQMPAGCASPSSGGASGRSSAAPTGHALVSSTEGEAETVSDGEAAAAWAESAPAAAGAAGTSIPATPALGGTASHKLDISSSQPFAGPITVTAAPKHAAAVQVPSPAALYAAMQAGKAATKAAPATEAVEAAGAAAAQQAATGPAGPAAARTGSSSALGAGQQVSVAASAVAEAAAPDVPPLSGMGGTLAEPPAAESPAQDGNSNRPKTAAGARLLEVVNLLRKRPSLKPNGLLWKLQASLAETVTEQERLKGEVAALQEEMVSLRCSSAAGLERCRERLDTVEEAVKEAAAAAAAAANSQRPVVAAPVAEVKLLEERVATIDDQVASSARRISALEEATELSTSAARLVRALSSGSSVDTMAALQGHLLAQQQKLQAQMKAMGASIRQAVPSQVSEAVAGAAGEIGRRLSERLATKQELQTVSVKVSSKVSREDVERMLRAHKAAAAPPPAPATDPGPAAGMRFRCISCDTALQPFVFAAAPGAAGGSGGAAQAHTADLRYTQLPVASPARNASQPWTAAAALGVEPAAAGLGGAEPSRLSVAGSPAAMDVPAVQQVQPAVQPPSPRASRPSTGAASRLGSPASWINRMSRGQTLSGSGSGGGSQADEALSPARARLATGSSMQEGGALLAAPPLSIGSIPRPVAAAPPASEDEAALPLGSKGGLLAVEQLRGTSEFSEAGIREEPACGATAGSVAGADDLHSLGGSKSSLPALPQSPGARIKAGPATASPGRGGSGGVQRRGSPAL